MSASHTERFAEAYGSAVGQCASEFYFDGKSYTTNYARYHLKWLRAGGRDASEANPQVNVEVIGDSL